MENHIDRQVPELSFAAPCSSKSFTHPMFTPSSPDWQPEPEPQNSLDRLIKKAAEDPSVQGEMFRKLMAANLHIYVPPHPELVGEHMRSTEEGFSWCTYLDAEGAFAAVFTSLVCARYELRSLKDDGKPKPMICELPADVLFGFLNDGLTTVRVLAAGGGTLKLQPRAVQGLVEGKFTHNRVRDDGGAKQAVTLTHVADEKVPMKLRQGIRVFCARNRVPIGVYVFHQLDEKTGQYPGNDLRVLLWLRSADNDFYNDFCLMAQRLTPPNKEFYCGGVLSDDIQAIEFLQKQKPIWPIFKPE